MTGIKFCGRRLTALVLGGAYESRDNGDGVKSTPTIIPLGDNQQARLVSVQCHKARQEEV
jgi:hypothetical protein